LIFGSKVKMSLFVQHLLLVCIFGWGFFSDSVNISQVGKNQHSLVKKKKKRRIFCQQHPRKCFKQASDEVI